MFRPIPNDSTVVQRRQLSDSPINLGYPSLLLNCMAEQDWIFYCVLVRYRLILESLPRQLLQPGVLYFIATDWKDPANTVMPQMRLHFELCCYNSLDSVLTLIIPDDGKKINLIFYTKIVKVNDSIRRKTASGEKPPYDKSFDIKWIKRIKDLRIEELNMAPTKTQPPPLVQ